MFFNDTAGLLGEREEGCSRIQVLHSLQDMQAEGASGPAGSADTIASATSTSPPPKTGEVVLVCDAALAQRG